MQCPAGNPERISQRPGRTAAVLGRPALGRGYDRHQNNSGPMTRVSRRLAAAAQTIVSTA